jgi:hypothetical protein
LSSQAIALPDDVDLDYAFGKTRNLVFDRVLGLFRDRLSKGQVDQAKLASRLGRDRGWVSRNLSGPGNWTLRTWSDLVEALGGEILLEIYPREDLNFRTNFDVYTDHIGISSRASDDDEMEFSISGIVQHRPFASDTSNSITDYQVRL